ncbi:MAG: Fe-S oxidoreductase, partial [Firmicutes bacterium]|nr:Fe-S oxidoreductase [Bacillota bacterium]
AQKLYQDYAPERSVASWGIRFAASPDNVLMVLSGMSNQEQINDNLSFMQDFQPLNDEERQLIEKAVSIIRGAIAIPCTACRYCVDDCPKKIAIPDY